MRGIAELAGRVPSPHFVGKIAELRDGRIAEPRVAGGRATKLRSFAGDAQR